MPYIKLGFSPDVVANYFLRRADNEQRPITPMKIQKLMYFAHGWHLALDPKGHPLVCESVQAWDYGPVFPHTYYEFKDFGNQPITRLAAKVVCRDGKLQIINPTLKDEKSKINDLSFAKSVLERIWVVYSRHSAVKLSEMTHAQGSPWWTVRKKAEEIYSGRIPKGLNIPNQLIRSWFKKRFLTAAV